VHGKNRSRLAYQVGYAVRNPDRLAQYARRHGRDTWLRLTTRDHIAY
jgi:hypothetical protein